MAVKNFKASVSGSILTLKIDLSKNNGMNQKGTALKVAEAYWGDYAELGLPEGYSASLVIMRKPTAKLKKSKVVDDVADEEIEEKPTAKKASKKTTTKKAAAKPIKKTVKKASKIEADNSNEEDVFAPKNNKRRAA